MMTTDQRPDPHEGGVGVLDFKGLRALVTGGASGIGLATAQALVSRGVRVAVIDKGALVGHPDLLGFQADLANDGQVRPAVSEAIENLGGLDILVNNAGIGAKGTVEDNPDEEWRHLFDVNVVGLVRVTRAALPALRRSVHGAIVNTSSIVAVVGLPNRALYTATKGAVYSLTLAMAADLLHEGIRVNCVTPGTTDTPWVKRLLDESADPVTERAALIDRQPLGRLVSAEEVAAAIVYLASPDAASITGFAMAVDGGISGLRINSGAK